jgi:hypothetical protein
MKTAFQKSLSVRGLAEGALLFLFFFIPLFVTLPDYGITYDEPIYMEAARNVQTWLSLNWRDLVDQKNIDLYWKTDPLRNVHPSGVKWLYLAAQKTVFWGKDLYFRNRLFNLLLLSLSMVLFLRWSLGPPFLPRAVAILLLLTIPRFFAHAHFAATDIPMTALLLVFVVLIDAKASHKSFWMAGPLLGFLASIKITSLLIALPLLFLVPLRFRVNRKRALFAVTQTCFLGALFFYLLNPDWWFAPWQRGVEFLTQTVTRRTWTPFTVFFAGNFYTYRGPFYSPGAIFVLTTPLLHLLFLFAGLALFFFDRTVQRNFKIILLFSGLLLPFLIMALPMSPTNDGVRYLLPAFPFAACFMTNGLIKLWRWVSILPQGSILKICPRAVLTAGCLVLLALDLHEGARQPPFELSYYNQFVGGLPGALRKGYEITYWWEIFNDPSIKQVNKRTAGGKVYFPLPPTDLFFKDMAAAGKITFAPVVETQQADFMLVLGRPYVSFWGEKGISRFAKQGQTIKPIWEISLESVPLLRLYKICPLTRSR